MDDFSFIWLILIWIALMGIEDQQERIADAAEGQCVEASE